MPGIFREASIVASTLLIIIAVMFSANWFFTVQGVPQRITQFITGHFHSQAMFLLTVNLLLLFLGGLMDSLSAMFITVPLLLPAAVAMGVNPVHFGVIFIVNFELGCLTPPVGLNLFTSGVVFRKPVSKVLRTSAPFILIMIGVLVLITYVPAFSLWAVEFLKH
jgi:tripartite ATP-independent transporter DctM subunit